MLRAEKPQKRPVTNLILRSYTIHDYQQCQELFVQLGQISVFVPPTGNPERICDKDLSFRTIYNHWNVERAASIVKSRSTAWLRHFPRWIANVRLCLPRPGHNRLLP